MPLLAMASATSSKTVALKWHRSLFHVEKPMGGVRAAPLSSACMGAKSAHKSAHDRSTDIVSFVSVRQEAREAAERAGQPSPQGERREA